MSHIQRASLVEVLTTDTFEQWRVKTNRLIHAYTTLPPEIGPGTITDFHLGLNAAWNNIGQVYGGITGNLIDHTKLTAAASLTNLNNFADANVSTISTSLGLKGSVLCTGSVALNKLTIATDSKSRILGTGSTSSSVFTEIEVGTGLTISGTTISLAVGAALANITDFSIGSSKLAVDAALDNITAGSIQSGKLQSDAAFNNLSGHIAISANIPDANTADGRSRGLFGNILNLGSIPLDRLDVEAATNKFILGGISDTSPASILKLPSDGHLSINPANSTIQVSLNTTLIDTMATKAIPWDKINYPTTDPWIVPIVDINTRILGLDDYVIPWNKIIQPNPAPWATGVTPGATLGIIPLNKLARTLTTAYLLGSNSGNATITNAGLSTQVQANPVIELSLGTALTITTSTLNTITTSTLNVALSSETITSAAITNHTIKLAKLVRTSASTVPYILGSNVHATTQQPVIELVLGVLAISATNVIGFATDAIINNIAVNTLPYAKIARVGQSAYILGSIAGALTTPVRELELRDGLAVTAGTPATIGLSAQGVSIAKLNSGVTAGGFILGGSASAEVKALTLSNNFAIANNAITIKRNIVVRYCHLLLNLRTNHSTSQAENAIGCSYYNNHFNCNNQPGWGHFGMLFLFNENGRTHLNSWSVLYSQTYDSNQPWNTSAKLSYGGYGAGTPYAPHSYDNTSIYQISAAAQTHIVTALTQGAAITTTTTTPLTTGGLILTVSSFTPAITIPVGALITGPQLSPGTVITVALTKNILYTSISVSSPIISGNAGTYSIYNLAPLPVCGGTSLIYELVESITVASGSKVLINITIFGTPQEGHGHYHFNLFRITQGNLTSIVRCGTGLNGMGTEYSGGSSDSGTIAGFGRMGGVSHSMVYPHDIRYMDNPGQTVTNTYTYYIQYVNNTGEARFYMNRSYDNNQPSMATSSITLEEIPA